MTYVNRVHHTDRPVNQRFNFPGFIFTGRADTPTEDIEVGDISVEGKVLNVEMRRLRKRSSDQFFLRAVYDKVTGEQLFKANSDNRFSLGVVADRAVIVFFNSDGNRIEEIKLLSSLVTKKAVSTTDLFQLKREMARSLGLDYRLSGDEIALQDSESAKKAEAEERRAFRERLVRDYGGSNIDPELQNKRLAKERRIKDLLSRPSVKVQTREGFVLFGIPVTSQSEWECLPNNTKVVLVESYNLDTGEVGKPVEHFRVQKTGGGKPKKTRPQTVIFCPGRVGTWAISPKKEHKSVLPIRKILVEDGEENVPVLVFPTMDSIRAAYEKGLNGGTLVTREENKPSGKWEVFMLGSKGISTYKHLPEAKAP